LDLSFFLPSLLDQLGGHLVPAADISSSQKAKDETFLSKISSLTNVINYDFIAEQEIGFSIFEF